MPVDIEKQWVAVDDGEQIIERAETKDRLKDKLPRDHGLEIVAVPKAHYGSFL